MLEVRARVIAALVVASVVAVAPVANYLCARNCEAPADQACPSHSPKPAPNCGHNHGVMSADLPRALASAGTPFGQPATIAAPVAFAIQIDSADVPLAQLLHSPPHLAAPLPALRI